MNSEYKKRYTPGHKFRDYITRFMDQTHINCVHVTINNVQKQGNTPLPHTLHSQLYA